MTREQMAEAHRAKYEQIAQWLGVEALKALVPFSPEKIREARAKGDEHLNTLGLSARDKQHGNEPDKVAHQKVCSCCKQVIPLAPDAKTAGVWGLVRAAIKRDVSAGRTPLRRSWSLSDTVCVLKHTARHHIA